MLQRASDARFPEAMVDQTLVGEACGLLGPYQ